MSESEFTFNILGYSVADGGMAYFIAYLIATFTAQCINFPLQRNITFRSHGKVLPQRAGALGVPDFIYNILTTILIGGVSMMIFFVVNKRIFQEGEAKKFV